MPIFAYNSKLQIQDADGQNIHKLHEYYISTLMEIRSCSCSLAIDCPLLTMTDVDLRQQSQMDTSCIDYLFIKETDSSARTPKQQLICCSSCMLASE